MLLLLLLLLLLSHFSHVRLCAPHRRQPTRFPCPWDSPGKNTGVVCHFLLQGIFPTQGSNSCLLVSCIDRWIIYHCTTWEALILTSLSVIDIDSYAFIATCSYCMLAKSVLLKLLCEKTYDRIIC